MSKKTNTTNTLTPFDARIHRLGRASTLIVWVFFILVPVAVCTFFHLKIDLLLTAKAAAPIMLIFAVTGVCEKLSMSPIIGPGAVYLASSTGNIQNMKLPAALNAMNIMDCEEGSEKGRVVSIIAVATSSFVTTIIVFCGMLFLAPIMTPLLTNPLVTPAFDNMFPALVGPMVIPVVLKNLKVAALPVALSIILALTLGSLYSTIQSVLMVVVILVSLGVYQVAYRRRSKGDSN